MSANNIEQPTEKLFLKFVGSDTENQAILFEEINKELEVFLTLSSPGFSDILQPGERGLVDPPPS